MSHVLLYKSCGLLYNSQKSFTAKNDITAGESRLQSHHKQTQASVKCEVRVTYPRNEEFPNTGL